MTQSFIAFGGITIGTLSIALTIYFRYSTHSSMLIKIAMGSGLNSNGVGTHLAALVSISNPGKEPIFFGGFCALDEHDELYYPSCEIKGGAKIEPGQYVQGAILAAHLIKPKAKALWAVDGVGKKHPVKRQVLKALLLQLRNETERLAAFGWR